MIQWFLQTDSTKGGALNELKETLSAPGLLDAKLKSNHIYAHALKYGAAFWILQEMGFFTKYRDATEKVLKASALGLAVLPGSGPYGANPGESRRDKTLPTPNPSGISPQIRGAF
jgi:hypothetical protein